MSRPDPSSLEVVLSDPDNTLVLRGTLVLQIRRGALTAKALDSMERIIRGIRTRSAGAGVRYGAISVLEESAAIAEGPIRARQREVIRALFDDVDAKTAVFIPGEGVSAMMLRTVSRGMMLGNPRVRVTERAEDAAEFVASHLGESVAAVLTALEGARALARDAR